MKVTKDQVEKALASLEETLGGDGEDQVSKASEQDLDQPEGADMGNPAKDKMSDTAKGKKKVAKAEASEEDGDGDEDDMEMAAKAKKAKKSFSEELPEEIQTKIDVSEFLKSLVDHTGEVIDGLRTHVAKSDLGHEARYGELSEAVEDIQKSQAKIGVVLKAICQRIGIIENAPARPAKAATETVAKSAAGSDRKFASGLEGDEGKEEKTFKSLSENPMIAKSQLASALCDLVKKGEANDLDVIGFESGGYIRPELVTKLKQSLN
jgi:hypothetical protein